MLQRKLDDINIKGSGNYCQTKLKLPPKLDKGSLNHQGKKKEALRIDYENVLMAQRLVSAKPSHPIENLEKQYNRNAKIIERMLSKDTMLKSVF